MNNSLAKTFLVRSMRVGDAETVAALSSELGYPTDGPAVSGRFTNLQSRPDNAMFVAADHMGIICGWLHAYGVRLLETDGYVEIGGIVVDSTTRRRGVGHALLEQAEAWAVEQGYGEVRLRSGIHREDAHAFYLAVGYEQSKASFMFRRTVA
jgi:GNAT superfamily N-acetyltransferase